MIEYPETLREFGAGSARRRCAAAGLEIAWHANALGCTLRVGLSS
jgi:hypothetical protein